MGIKNVEELRAFLSNEMTKLAKGEATPASVNAVANLAGKMLQSVKLEVEYNRIVGATPNIDFLNNLLNPTKTSMIKTREKLEETADANKENM